MDQYILDSGGELLNKTEESLYALESIDYLGIIKRSMKRNEICLGRVDEGNIRVVESVEIGTLKGVSYNLIEEDVYSYLKKVQKRNSDLDLKKYVDVYVDLAHLNQESRDYVNILLSTPYDSLRQWYRYKYNKRRLPPEEYLKNIKATMEYEL